MHQFSKQLRLVSTAVLFALISSAAVAAERHYGSTVGLEFRVEDDPQAAETYLQVWQVDSSGRAQPLMRSLRMKKHGAMQEISGLTLAHGVEQKITVSLAEDRTSLTWLQPTQLRRISGEPIELAGEHALLDEATRRSAADGQFAAADKQLNLAYSALRNAMDAEDFAELRANQRLWLKYRDRFVADGDDAAINGPGSLPFLRQQIARTLERVEFLQTIAKPRAATADLSGVYRDGMDRELRLRTIPSVETQIFFSLSSAYPGLHDKESFDPLLVNGRAIADANARSWTADANGINHNSIVTADSELLIEPAADLASVLISSASSAVYTGRLYFIGVPTPATEPMREILRRLPVAIFDNTTEGLSEQDRIALLLKDRSDPFELLDGRADFIRVAYAEGSVSLRRFPRHDGGAWIAVETHNAQARSFELWALMSDQSPARKLSLSSTLPSFDARDFFDDPGAAAEAQGRVDFSLSEDRPTIDVSWLVDGKAPQADRQNQLHWDGFGFGRED